MTYVYSAITTETKKLGINRFCVHLFLCRDICTITRGYLEKSREIIMTSPNMTYISVDMKSHDVRLAKRLRKSTTYYMLLPAYLRGFIDKRNCAVENSASLTISTL